MVFRPEALNWSSAVIIRALARERAYDDNAFAVTFFLTKQADNVIKTTTLVLSIWLTWTVNSRSQTSWIGILTDSTRTISWFDCADSLNCLMIGKPSLSTQIMVSKTTDGGYSFEEFPLPREDKHIGYPEHIFYASIDTAYVLADHGQFFRSLDGGRTWGVFSIIRDLPATYYTPMHFRGSQNIVVAARGIPETVDSLDMVYRSVDGGESWNGEFLPSPPGDSMMHPGAICDLPSGRTVAIWYGVGLRRHFFSTNAAESDLWSHTEFPESEGFFRDFVCVSDSTYYLTYMIRKPLSPRGRYAYSLILRSTNYGQTWETIFDGLTRDTVTIIDLEFRDARNALATSSDAIFRTTDGGTSWTREAFISPPYQPNRVIASYPEGSDGIVVSSGGPAINVYRPDKSGDVAEGLQEIDGLRDVRVSRTRFSDGNQYLLTFESPDGAGVQIQLYDLLGSALFSAEYETTVGSNRIVVDLPPHSSSAGFLRILSDGGDVTFPVMLGL